MTAWPWFGSWNLYCQSQGNIFQVNSIDFISGVQLEIFRKNFNRLYPHGNGIVAFNPYFANSFGTFIVWHPILDLSMILHTHRFVCLIITINTSLYGPHFISLIIFWHHTIIWVCSPRLFKTLYSLAKRLFYHIVDCFYPMRGQHLHMWHIW